MPPDPSAFSDEVALDLRAVLHAQHDLIQRIQTAIGETETAFDSNDETRSAIEAAERLLAELEADQHLLPPETLVDFDPDEIERIYAERHAAVQSDLVHFEYRDWVSFVRQCEVYDLQRGLDPLKPYEALLTDADIDRLRTESYDAHYAWDGWDKTIVGVAGVLATLTDYFLVKIPRDMTKKILGQKSPWYGQSGSPLTKWVHSYNTSPNDGPAPQDLFARFARWCEERCKAPFDAQQMVVNGEVDSIRGMNGDFHRLQSIAHDPTPLGLIAGVLDILRGTVTGFAFHADTGVHIPIHRAAPITAATRDQVAILEAVLVWLGHMVSDVATHRGLPAPFLTLFQLFNTETPGHGRINTVGRTARWMYYNGYDLRHFFVSGITPGVIELIVRGYIMLRHYAEHGDTRIRLAGNPKYRSMLLAAHAVAAAANAGKVALYQGNPLAINQAEWMALIRYLVPHMKYWLLDKHRLRLEHMDRINEAGWDDLLRRGGDIMARVGRRDLQRIELGRLTA